MGDRSSSDDETQSTGVTTATVPTTLASLPEAGWLPLPVSESAFVFDERWPDCIHPGVVQSCAKGWCQVPAGCYIFGSPEDTPGRGAVGEEQGPVTLTYDMEVMQYELTWAQYDELTGWPRKVLDGECNDDQCPAKMSWWEAMLYANLLSAKHEPPLQSCYDLGEGCVNEPGERMTCPKYQMARPGYECSGYRIPNQYERQYFARAGTRTDFYTGNLTYAEISDCQVDPALERIAWYCGNSQGIAAHHVGQRLPNAWGLYDLYGNVVEFLQTPERRSPEYPAVDPVEAEALGLPRTNAAGGNVISYPVMMQAAKYLSGDVSTPRLVRTLGPGVLPQLAQ